MIICGTKRGSIQIYQLVSGALLAEVDSAHYLAISDLDVSHTSFDLVLTGGKDSKVRLWITAELLANSS